jgi:hypothetical protein
MTQRKSPHEEKAATTGMTWSDLIRWTLINISWKFVGAAIIVAVLLIPILYIYRLVFPELFSPRPPAYVEDSVLLAAGQLWMLSGIRVREGEEIKLRATGGVNLATHRLVWNSLSDTRPSFGWTFLPGPTSEDSIPPRPSNDLNDGLIHPNAPEGSLLMFIRPDNSLPSSINPRPSDSPNQDYILVAPKVANEWISVTAPRSGELCFVVNDVVADNERFYVAKPERYVQRVKTLNEISDYFRKGGPKPPETTSAVSREVGEYFGRFLGWPPETPEEYAKKKQQEWLRLHGSGYKRLFHDDNSGFYFITIRKEVR